MGLEVRKTNVNFLSYDSVVITNFLYQKTFTLKEPIAVDLYTLKKIKLENIGELSDKSRIDSPFFIYFTQSKKEFYGTVFFRPSSNKVEEHGDIVNIKFNNIDYKVTVYIKD